LQRAAFSRAAHLAARTQVYPVLFPGRLLAFSDVVEGTRLDLDYGIDRYLAVEVECLRRPLVFGVQERFRDAEAMGHDDVTNTEWNERTDQPSELYKIHAHLFVYGFYDPADDRVLLAMALYTGVLLEAIAAGRIGFTRGRNPTNGTAFLAVRRPDLTRSGALLGTVTRRPASQLLRQNSSPRGETDGKDRQRESGARPTGG
jgi:hypothetical protein